MRNGYFRLTGSGWRLRLAADSVAQVQHPIALDHCVRAFEQMLGIARRHGYHPNGRAN
jgi:hypothetical protein